jgi:hypothetical protein
MGDHTTEMLEVQSSRDEKYARKRLLGWGSLYLDVDTISWIMNHIDCFVSQSRGNKSISLLKVCPHTPFGGHDDDAWEKFGQAIGNLQALEKLSIKTTLDCHDEAEDCEEDSDEDSDEVLPTESISDWEILARILRHVRQNVTVSISDERLRSMEEVQPFARAICGHPSIKLLQDNGRFPYESLDTLFSTLATLPALESVTLRAPEVRQADESNLAHPESLTKLLRAPSLRFVYLIYFKFTRALCQATANALMEGTAVTRLDFSACSFSSEESAAILANGLSRNTSVASITIHCSGAQVLFDVLAAALPSNSTLRNLHLLDQQDYHPDSLSPVFSALGHNIGVKSLIVHVFKSIDDSLCAAMKYGLGTNETFECLVFIQIPLCDESAAVWSRSFSFLRACKTLKSLSIILKATATDLSVSTLRSDIACMQIYPSPPCVVTLLACCKRTRHLRVFPCKASMVVSKLSHRLFRSRHRAPTQYSAQIPQL